MVRILESHLQSLEEDGTPLRFCVHSSVQKDLDQAHDLDQGQTC